MAKALQSNACISLLACLLLVLLTCAGAGCKAKNKAARTTPDLTSFTACSQLETKLKDNLRQEMRASLLYYDDSFLYIQPGDGDYLTPSDDVKDGAFTGAENYEEGVDYSGTNNQEAGVDEADFVKTDGSCLFVINSSKLFIMPVPQFGLLDNGTSTEIEGAPFNLLLHKNSTTGKADRAAVFSNIYAYDISPQDPLSGYLAAGMQAEPGMAYRASQLTKLTVLDLSTEPPALLKELYFEGSYQTARLIDSSVYVVMYSWLDMPGLKYWPELPDAYYTTPGNAARKFLWNAAVQKALADNERLIASLTLQDLVPRYYERSAGAVLVHDSTHGACTNFSIADDGSSRSFTSILSFDLLDDAVAVDDDHIVTGWGTVYAAPEALIIAEPAQDLWWYYDNKASEEATNIHKFALTAGSCTYTGSGRVSGSINNQFSLSLYQGSLRIATTTNSWTRWWDSEPAAPDNHVYILTDADNGSLRTAGHVAGIATGERIWSSRFIGTKGYLVTFLNTDPLWTIDLSDTANPKVIGELEVPGVATYIHPLADDRLLTIGYGGDDNGLDGSIQVSLFNVADFAHPLAIDEMTLSVDNSSSSWSTSEAVYEHKAFQYWAPLQLLAVPLSGSTSSWDMDGKGTYSYLSKLVLLKVNKNTGFSMHGEVDHSAYYQAGENNWYWSNPDIQRSIFMGDYLYALSDKAVTVHRTDTLAKTDAVMLPGTGYSSWGFVAGDTGSR